MHCSGLDIHASGATTMHALVVVVALTAWHVVGAAVETPYPRSTHATTLLTVYTEAVSALHCTVHTMFAYVVHRATLSSVSCTSTPFTHTHAHSHTHAFKRPRPSTHITRTCSLKSHTHVFSSSANIHSQVYCSQHPTLSVIFQSIY